MKNQVKTALFEAFLAPIIAILGIFDAKK